MPTRRNDPSGSSLLTKTCAGARFHDSQAGVRRVSSLLAQAQSQDRQASQSRDVQDPRCGREARTRGAVLQARRLIVLRRALRSLAILDMRDLVEMRVDVVGDAVEMRPFLAELGRLMRLLQQ